MPQQHVRERASSPQPSIDVACRTRAADGGRARAFSWRNWYAHGA